MPNADIGTSDLLCCLETILEELNDGIVCPGRIAEGLNPDYPGCTQVAGIAGCRQTH
jgi:hypothetical protein